jgi:hypothetical protein
LQIGSTVAEQPRPVSHSARLHCTLWQLPFAKPHFTSHAHEVPQETVSHEFGPAQFSVQAPGPHMTPRHEARPVHWMLHEAALPQLMPLRHELSPLQRMSQLKPAGQTTCALQFAPAPQSMMQTLPSMHRVHCGGHMLVSIGASRRGPSDGAASMPLVTHRPSLHIRPASQSDVVVHSNRSLLWLIEQLPAAAATATEARANQTKIHFMACLRT